VRTVTFPQLPRVNGKVVVSTTELQSSPPHGPHVMKEVGCMTAGQREGGCTALLKHIYSTLAICLHATTVFG